MNNGRSFLSAAAIALLAASPVLAQDSFAKVNGQVITREEYVRALEQMPVTLPGASAPVEAGRLVLDQLIARMIILDEAAKRRLLPSDAEVQKRYDLQKRLVEMQMPGQSLDALLKQQGTTQKLIKDEMRFQMAETNLLAREIGLSEGEIKKAYESYKSQIGLPERTQLRIIAPQNDDEFRRAQTLLRAKTEFAKVAQQFNAPSLRASGGLMAQPIPHTAMPPAWLPKVRQMAPGSVFGPVDWPASGAGQPAAKIWVRIEKKYPAIALPYEEAKALVKQQLVQSRASDPKGDNIRRLIDRRKLEANFQASDPRHQAVWEELKRRAQQVQQSQAGAGRSR